MPLFWPVFVEQVLSVAIGLISTAMVAGISGSAVAGVGLISSLNFLVMNAFTSVATGTTVVVAHCIGRGDGAGARKTAEQSLALVFYISVLVGALMIIFDRPILSTLFNGAEADVLDSARVYLLYSSASMPLLAVYSTINGILRAAGDVKTPMLGSLAAIVSNIAVAAAAIFVFDMGVAGAGLGVVAFRLAPTVFLIWNIRRGHGILAGIRLSPNVSMNVMRPVINIALPAGVDSLIFNGCKLIVQIFMSDMGTDVLAAYAILLNLTSVVNMPAAALSVLVVSIAGQSYGAGEVKQACSRSWQFTFMGAAFTAVTGVIIMVFLHPIVGLFGANDAVYKLVYNCTAMFIVLAPVFWSPSFLTPNALRSMDKARYTMVVSIASMILLRVFGAWFMGVYMGLALYGIWASMFIDWVGRGAFFAGALWRESRRTGAGIKGNQ